MAVSIINKTVLMTTLRVLGSNIASHPNFYSKYQPGNEDKEGILEDFTSELMRRKTHKWENNKILARKNVKGGNKLTSKVIASDRHLKQPQNLCFDLSLLPINEITLLFQQAADYNDSLTIIELVQQCSRYDKIPPLSTLLQALSVCSRNGDKEAIVLITQLCEKLQPEVLPKNSHFEHYLAEAIWIKGNITKSLEIFEKVYKENVYLRRKVRCALKYLILDIVSNNSEAILVNIVKFSEMLLREYGDSFALACIWQQCFLSEWFTDQQVALNLLERNPSLCEAIVGRIPYVVRVSLRFHRTEVIYRLTELLLKFEMESEIAQVVLAMMDYWIRNGDLRQCNEVIRWSIKNNIVLPKIIQNSKFINKFDDGSEAKQKEDIDSVKKPSTEYKF